MRRKYTELRDKEIVRRLNGGDYPKNISTELGITLSQVWDARRRELNSSKIQQIPGKTRSLS